MPLYRKTISSYPEVEKYLISLYGDISSIMNVPIIEVPKDLWDKFRFKGYGYVVRADQLLQNQTFLELAFNNQEYYKRLPSDEHKRDVNVYRIWKNTKPDLFILVLQSEHNKFFIIHEFSHLLGDLDYKELKFNDEYLDTKSEQTAHLNEMKYAQENGISFEDYFKNSFPDAFNAIDGYEKGNADISKEIYDYAKMDESDYRTMWAHIKT